MKRHKLAIDLQSSRIKSCMLCSICPHAEASFNDGNTCALISNRVCWMLQATMDEHVCS